MAGPIRTPPPDIASDDGLPARGDLRHLDVFDPNRLPSTLAQPLQGCRHVSGTLGALRPRDSYAGLLR